MAKKKFPKAAEKPDGTETKQGGKPKTNCRGRRKSYQKKKIERKMWLQQTLTIMALTMKIYFLTTMIQTTMIKISMTMIRAMMMELQPTTVQATMKKHPP